MAGQYDQAKGRIKVAVGEITGNQKLKNQGQVDKAAGKIKSGVEKVKKALQGKR